MPRYRPSGQQSNQAGGVGDLQRHGALIRLQGDHLAQVGSAQDVTLTAVDPECLSDRQLGIRQGIGSNRAGGHGLDGQVAFDQGVAGAQIVGCHDNCLGWCGA